MRSWNYAFEVPEEKKIRVLIHTDAKNEADDQFAIVHHLMTPKFIVKGLIGGHFDLFPREWGKGGTAGASVEEIRKVLGLMDLEGAYPVAEGSGIPLPDERTPLPSPGADLIIAEAMRDDPRPLFIGLQGALTDLASAILLEPEICGRMTAIWIGGGIYPEGGTEFNLRNDVAAANVVFRSSMPVWQVPMNVYKQMAVSLAELQVNVRPRGRIGAYLFQQMADFNMALARVPHWPHGEIWGLGDSPTVGLLLTESERTDLYDLTPAPEFDPETCRYVHTGKNREIRVYRDANARLTLADFYAKLAINFPNPED